MHAAADGRGPGTACNVPEFTYGNRYTKNQSVSGERPVTLRPRDVDAKDNPAGQNLYVGVQPRSGSDGQPTPTTAPGT